MSNYNLRRYKQSDINTIITLIKTFIDEERIEGYSNYFKGLDFSEEKLYKELTSQISNPLFFCNIVETTDGTIFGGLSADIVEFVFSHQRLAQDRLFYISPGHVNLSAVFALN